MLISVLFVSVSCLSRNKHAAKKEIGNRPVEEAKKTEENEMS